VILYLHGLNSSEHSVKAGILRERLAPIPVLSPTYPAHRADDAVTFLSSYMIETLEKDTQPLIIVGSSMGGFYGQYLARHFTVDQLVMINPALAPWDLLLNHLGHYENPSTGEKYTLSAEDVTAYRRYEVKNVCDGVATILLLDKSDELIDYRIASRLYADCGKVYLFEDGNHGFEHMDEAIHILLNEL